jgi:hypothetical protein
MMTRDASIRFAATVSLLAANLVPCAVRAQYQPTPENLAAREWFQDAKFGMFIHWGIYSLLQDGEWVMNNRGITVEEYETLAPQFNPVKFDAAEWVSLERAVGEWMGRYGESICGTRGGPIPPRPWGVTTQKDNLVFVHVLDWTDPELSLPRLPAEVRGAMELVSGASVTFRSSADGVTLTLPRRTDGEVDQIIVLEIER